MNTRRILCLILALCLCVTLVPVPARAATVSYAEMLARAEAIVNYTWTPNQRIATWNGNTYNGKTYFEAGQTVKGMPYTLFYNELGFDSLLSLAQYKNVASSNYSTTEYCTSVSATRTGPAYGSCCATFVSEVFGGSFMNGNNPRYDSVSGIKNSKYGTTYYNVTASNIQSGDALSNTSGGHIVWIGEVTDSTITIYEQTPPVAKKTVVNKSSVNSSGYLVHDGAVYSTVTRSNELTATPASAPTDAWIYSTASAVELQTGEVTFTFGATNATNYTIGIDRLSTGRVLTKELTSGTYTTTFDQCGIYTVYATCYNSAGSVDTSTVTVVVYQNLGMGDEFNAVILNTACWKPIGVDSEGVAHLETEAGKSHQYWRFTRQSDGSYTITSAYNGKLLEEYMGENVAYTPVVAAAEDWGGNYQRWYIYREGDGHIFVSKHYVESHLVMDLCDNNSADGTPIIMYPINGSAAQIWSIYAAEDVQLKGPTLTVNVGDSAAGTRFTWNEVYGESRYDVKIWAGTAWEGDAYHIEWGTASGYEIVLPAGTYQAYVDASNYLECKMSNLVTFTVPEHVHSYTNVVTAPTCTEQGYTTYTCNSCGYSYRGMNTAAMGHQYSYELTVTPTLSTEGKITGSCDRCKADTSVTMPMLNTTDYTYKVLREATCTEDGSERYTWNVTDYGQYLFTVNIPAAGHNFFSTIIVGCVEQGYTQHSCMSCAYSYQDDYTDPVGHDFGIPIYKAPTCTESGSYSYTCKRIPCLYSYVEEIPPQHSYRTLKWPASCTTQGFTSYSCTKCDHSYRDDYVDALGHDYVDGECTRCGEADPGYDLAVASGWSGDTTWVLTDDGVLTFSGEGGMKNYEYKSEMPWYAYADQINSVVIEEGVTSIGDYAFYGMNIVSIEIPESVTTIGDYAFKNAAKLDNVVLPSGLTKLGESAFYACTSLTSIEIPASLWTVQPYTFKNCTSLASVTFHDGNLQKISDGAFYGTALKAVELPDCLAILDVYVFKNCSQLAQVKLSSSLTQIREASLYGTAISTIEIPEGVTSIKPYAFKNCVKLETIDLPESLTSVGEAAFYACTALKTVVLPDAVTAIGNYAFRKCAGLTSVKFGSGLVTIGESSFYGCSGITTLSIPRGVTTIKGYAFKGCSGLISVSLPTTLTTLGESAFHSCTGLSEIIIPAKVSSIGEYCFSGSTGIRNVEFLGNAPAIGTGAFNKITATVYYPGDNATWTDSVKQNYGGNITWKAQ